MHRAFEARDKKFHGGIDVIFSESNNSSPKNNRAIFLLQKNSMSLRSEGRQI